MSPDLRRIVRELEVIVAELRRHGSEIRRREEEDIDDLGFYSREAANEVLRERRIERIINRNGR